jgi:hypothetical protein
MGTTMNDDIDFAVEETRAFLAERSAPDLTRAVMGEIASLEPLSSARKPGIATRLLRLLWMPREISIRPAFALAGAAAVLVVLAVPYVDRDPDGMAADGGRSPAAVFVQFRLEAMASRVQLAGSFTNWEPRYELREAAPGVWSITVPLTQGVHDYAFVVDGQQWVADPYAPQIGDGFGGTNNRLALLPPDSPRL